MDDCRAIHEFWFGRLPMTADALAQRMVFWFGGGPDEQRRRDAEIRDGFGAWIEPAARGELEAWTAEPRGRLCLILVLDQFPRNIFRGTAAAFAYDSQALRSSLDAIRARADASLDPVENVFLYMPLQHAESLALQDRAVDLYRGLLAQAPPALRPQFERTLGYAEQHRSIVARFGRFPHRNAVLGRDSTPDEIEYLRTADSFGQ